MKFQTLIQSKLKPGHVDYVPPPRKQPSPQRKNQSVNKKRKFKDIVHESSDKTLSPAALAKLNKAYGEQKNRKRMKSNIFNE